DACRAAEPLRHAMEDKYHVAIGELAPRVFYRITDNWLELTVRFVVDDHQSRQVKDAMARAILDAFDAAGIGIASTTVEVVGVPTLRIEGDGRSTGVTAED